MQDKIKKISEKVGQCSTMQDIKKNAGQCRTGRHHATLWSHKVLKMGVVVVNILMTSLKNGGRGMKFYTLFYIVKMKPRVKFQVKRNCLTLFLKNTAFYRHVIFPPDMSLGSQYFFRYILRDHSISTFAQRGRGGVWPKVNTAYKIFPYMKNEQGEGGKKMTKFERTYFLNGPLWHHPFIMQNFRTIKALHHYIFNNKVPRWPSMHKGLNFTRCMPH